MEHELDAVLAVLAAGGAPERVLVVVGGVQALVQVEHGVVVEEDVAVLAVVDARVDRWRRRGGGHDSLALRLRLGRSRGGHHRHLHLHRVVDVRFVLATRGRLPHAQVHDAVADAVLVVAVLERRRDLSAGLRMHDAVLLSRGGEVVSRDPAGELLERRDSLARDRRPTHHFVTALLVVRRRAFGRRDLHHVVTPPRRRHQQRGGVDDTGSPDRRSVARRQWALQAV